ncbi:MAG: 23S rRNA (adenine(2503)-C(2))-methyltransferase RlmN [Oscillospiraceae bacterium]|jgi:23S rRNA (adenine2503-C2)-methyltransferase|nr:23S rRNA (adenine(2503)-C(2))-methyltransferase RlmN [Oscillospiraceae bacterium]
MADLRSLYPDELQSALAPLRLPDYRARQIFDWLQRRGAQSAGEMTSLPKGLRAQLEQDCQISSCEILSKQVSASGARKYLFRLHDGQAIESVLMRYAYGYSACVSTQAGCRMACAFCASGQQGFTRDLLPGEMLAQVQAAQRDLGEAVSHIVLMGMGEPLDNYGNTVKFLRLASHPEGLNVGRRKISLSTCGLVPQIDRLAGERLGVTLSVSLHAPNDGLRDRLMPVNRAYPVGELLAACGRYAKATGRRVSFEYALLRGVNDKPEHARELAGRLKGMLCHVNLIPANPVPGLGFHRSAPEQARVFQETLEKSGLAVTVRRSLGGDIAAACGQLRKGGTPCE